VTAVEATTEAEAAGQRSQRADAVKNRLRILEAADDVFAAQGVSAPVDVVAEKAGVGVGTLYRHFPTKESLIEAVVVTRLEWLVAEMLGAADSPDPGEALFSSLHRFARQAATKRDLFDALGAAGVDIKANCADTFALLESAFTQLLDRAVASGAVRSDVTADEVIGLVAGTCMAVTTPGHEQALDRMVDIVCDGLRAPDRP
jgi:AcrR family transcriptional regulator